MEQKGPKNECLQRNHISFMKFFQVQGKEIELAPPLLHSYEVEGVPILLPHPVFLNSKFLKRPKVTISMIKLIPKFIKIEFWVIMLKSLIFGKNFFIEVDF